METLVLGFSLFRFYPLIHCVPFSIVTDFVRFSPSQLVFIPSQSLPTSYDFLPLNSSSSLLHSSSVSPQHPLHHFLNMFHPFPISKRNHPDVSWILFTHADLSLMVGKNKSPFFPQLIFNLFQLFFGLCFLMGKKTSLCVILFLSYS